MNNDLFPGDDFLTETLSNTNRYKQGWSLLFERVNIVRPMVNISHGYSSVLPGLNAKICN